MKKTILSVTILSFTFLSLHVHSHEHEHTFDEDHASDHIEDHASDHITVEEDCSFCLFNSEDSLAESSTFSAKIHFKNISLEKYIVNYISFRLSCFLNKSPPQ